MLSPSRSGETLASSRVDVELAEPALHSVSANPIDLSCQRAHWRLSWAERLAHNAPKTARDLDQAFGIPDAFATASVRIA